MMKPQPRYTTIFDMLAILCVHASFGVWLFMFAVESKRVEELRQLAPILVGAALINSGFYPIGRELVRSFVLRMSGRHDHDED
jgi:hypothetical protein